MTGGQIARCLVSTRAPLGLVAVVSLALLAASCASGSSGSHAAQLGSTTATSSNAAAALNFPDPNRAGAIPKVSLQQLGVSTSQFQTAQRACQKSLPNGGQSSAAQVQRVMTALSRFARCVRSDGVPSWPDPLAESDAGEPGTPGFPRNMPGVNQDAPQVENALAKCQHLLAGIGYASGGYP
jgi:hypothetical protein